MFRKPGQEHPSYEMFMDSIKGQPVITKQEAEKILITNEQLQKHNKPEDCWVSYRGYVYNVTEYVHFHPGGTGCFGNYFGYDITIIVRGFHKNVNIEKFICAVIIGKLDGEPQQPPQKQCGVERGQL